MHGIAPAAEKHHGARFYNLAQAHLVRIDTALEYKSVRLPSES
jgi:hypothetical protein